MILAQRLTKMAKEKLLLWRFLCAQSPVKSYVNQVADKKMIFLQCYKNFGTFTTYNHKVLDIVFCTFVITSMGGRFKTKKNLHVSFGRV